MVVTLCAGCGTDFAKRCDALHCSATRKQLDTEWHRAGTGASGKAAPWRGI
jgi:hypothetical protein